MARKQKQTTEERIMENNLHIKELEEELVDAKIYKNELNELFVQEQLIEINKLREDAGLSFDKLKEMILKTKA